MLQILAPIHRHRAVISSNEAQIICHINHRQHENSYLMRLVRVANRSVSDIAENQIQHFFLLNVNELNHKSLIILIFIFVLFSVPSQWPFILLIT